MDVCTVGTYDNGNVWYIDYIHVNILLVILQDVASGGCFVTGRRDVPVLFHNGLNLQLSQHGDIKSGHTLMAHSTPIRNPRETMPRTNYISVP